MGRKKAATKTGAPKILLVDDSGVVRRMAGKVLSEAGHDVDTAESGEAAFELCLDNHYDLLVTDVTMGALSGVQLCRLLRSDPSTEGMPIVMLTAADDSKSRFWGRNAGADVYIAKESMRAELLPHVTSLLERSESRERIEGVVAGRRTGPLERLSTVLEQHLFQAVVASEVRSLMADLEDRQLFSKSVLGLAAEVADYAYLVLRLDGPAGPTFTLHARGPWPQTPEPGDLAALYIPEGPTIPLEVVAEADQPAAPPEVGEHAVFPVDAGGERLGEITVFGGRRRLAGSDRTTIKLIASEMGVVTKSVFLVEQTKRLADTDGLTGLHNRRRCAESLAMEVARAERQDGGLSVLLCDVDHFKKVNDQFGHNVGDDVLREGAKVLRNALRLVDSVGRWGGEEFIAILPSTTLTGARVVAERLRSHVEQMPAVPDGPQTVTMSVGVAAFVPGMDAESLVEAADRALYRAKRRGRNRVEVESWAERMSIQPE